jgi:hypothetical protein
MSGTQDEEWESFLLELQGFLEYVGFDPKVTRKVLRDKMQSLSHGGAELVALIQAYINFGNKYAAKSQKTRQPTEAVKLVTKLGQYGVTEIRPQTPEQLTLARIAAAHAPLVLAVRKVLARTNRLPTSGMESGAKNPMWMDLSLGVYTGTVPDDLYNEMALFLEEFALTLNKDAKRRKLPNAKETADEVLDSMHSFRKAAVANLGQDEVNLGLVNMLGDVTIKDCLEAYGYDTGVKTVAQVLN